MAEVEGSEQYNVDVGRLMARGVSWDEETLSDILVSRVLAMLWDTAGRENLRDLLEDLPETDFQRDRLEETLKVQPALESWRICEALGEVFLTDGRGCFFPWPAGRDLKNPAGSPAGADLVGFSSGPDGERFVFGEVKSSESEETPPGVMYGRSGLVKQLEKLRDDASASANLVRYLGFRAGASEWEAQYREAAKRYFANATDISLFGVLVRDTAPNELDLRSRAEALGTGHPEETLIELRAKYLPPGTLAKLTEMVERMAHDAGHL